MNSSKYKIWNIIRGSRKFCQRGPNSDKFFFVLFFRGERGSKNHHKQAIIGLPAKCHWNGVSLAWPIMAHIECWLCSFVIFRRSRPVVLGYPIYFCDFQGGQDPCPPSGSAHEHIERDFCSDARLVGLFDLNLYVPSKIFQLNRDGSS